VSAQPPHTKLPLSTRPCVIAGEAAPDDWSVVCDGVAIGRILRTHMLPDGKAWLWSITCRLRTSRATITIINLSVEALDRGNASPSGQP
jgi:hypothetical protein